MLADPRPGAVMTATRPSSPRHDRERVSCGTVSLARVLSPAPFTSEDILSPGNQSHVLQIDTPSMQARWPTGARWVFVVANVVDIDALRRSTVPDSPYVGVRAYRVALEPGQFMVGGAIPLSVNVSTPGNTI